MSDTNYKAILESVLFTMGESVALGKLAAAAESRLWSWTVLTRCVPNRRCMNI